MIRSVATVAFNNREYDFNFEWSGGNLSSACTVAAHQLIAKVLNVRKGMNSDEPLTLVGHSHGGNVAIEAINIMIGMPEFKNGDINLITINTPVRNDYQLSKGVKKRVYQIKKSNKKK